MNLPVLSVPPGLAAFALLAGAHTAPWAAGRLLGGRWAAPIDGGAILPDGARLFGAHKTWRGALAALLLCALIAPLLGHRIGLGLAFAALAMGGDLLSSLLKRRLRVAPGREIPGLDQIPEALLPLFTLAGSLRISVASVALLSVLFTLFDLAAIPLRHPRQRNRPPR